MALAGPLSVFLCSLTAIPLPYMLNQLGSMKDPLFIMMAGGLALAVVSIVPFLVVRNRPQKIDSFFYVLGIFTFTSVIDLVIALENDGIVANFMSFYLRDGEPYLKTAHGTLISYWDGVAHYAMYLLILAAQSWNQSYRDVGLYWAGSMGHSVMILMPSVLIGPNGVRWPCLLNLVFIALSFYFGAKFFFQPRQDDDFEIEENPEPPAASIWKRPMDFFFVLYFLAASVLAVLRFTAAFDGKVRLAQYYLHHIEPYLGDTTTFSKVQMMVYLFYFLPYYIAAIYGLLWPGHTWMLDWSLLHAGAAAQGQFAHIGASFHYRTPFSYRVPQSGQARIIFWLINGSMFIVPQVLAYRCLYYPSFFIKPTDEKQVEGDDTKEKKKV
ncbi:transmembrane 6 superfamily member 1-like [Babylonia areolata]|uniref:transmembrane 6 superfamily member 1-like n=1 Tax=Babylonia areolata TaxID=304850 RepID=UPI003FD5F5FD